MSHCLSSRQTSNFLFPHHSPVCPGLVQNKLMVGLMCRLLGQGVSQISSFFFAITSGLSGERLLMGGSNLC